MDLLSLKDLTKDYRPDTYSPSLREAIETAIVRDLKIGTTQRTATVWGQVIAMWVFIALAVATFIIGVGGALHLWLLDEKAFAPIWGTFAASFVTLIAGALTNAWKAK